MTKNKKIKINKKLFKDLNQIKYIAAGLGVALVLYYFKGSLVAAVVNGRPIFRTTYVKTLESMAGKQALDSLITRSLILAEAKSQGIKMDEAEIDEEIVKLEEMMEQQGQGLDEVLELQNLSRKSLRDDIKMQKLVEKMAQVEDVPDEEVAEYIAENQENFPAETDMEELTKSVKEQLREQRLTEKIQTLIMELHEKARIINWTN